jgi:hypothetical protein
MFHGPARSLRCFLILGFFADDGKKAWASTIAPTTEPMLDSAAMCASAGKLFDTPRSFALSGSLALLLRR